MLDQTATSPTVFEKTTRFLGLFLLAPLLALATIPVAVHISQKPDFGFAVHRLEVHSLVPGGPADQAGMRAGDRILEVNSRPVEDMAHWYAATAGNYERFSMLFLVQRGVRQLPLTVHPDPPRQMILIRDYSLWVAGLAFLLIGWWVFSKRRDLVARNFFALCTIFAFFLLDVPELPRVDYMVAKESLRALLQLMLPAYFLRFFLHFPSPRYRPGGTLRRWRILLIPGWALFLSLLVLDFQPETSGLTTIINGLETLALVYYVAFFVAGLVVFTRRILRRDRPIQRSRMLVILLGLVAGFLPFLVAMLVANLEPANSPAQTQYLAISLLLVPVSFGLSIMRYGALDRSFVLRISLIYGGLTLMVLAAYFLIVVLLGQLLANLFSISTYPVLLLVVAACSLTILPMRRLIQSWIDDTFYPGRRATREAVSHLGRELTSLIESEDVVQKLLQGLHNLFRPGQLTLLLSPGPEAELFESYSLKGQPTAPQSPIPLALKSSLSILLNRLRRPVFAEELEDLLFTGDTDSDSLAFLTRLKTNLLLPLISGNRLLGFIAFGPKSSGTLYTQEDLSNLNNLAVQLGSLLESRQLYRENLQRKKTEAELELARSIQKSLLPSEPLETDEMVIAGCNESCRRVGGDYFDYFLRKDGALAFALADVAGKGIPAALHMTSLRVAFRQEAEAEDVPHLVVNRLNNTVASLVSSGQFICLFYGLWDPVSGLLSYCNAGCEPPVLTHSQRQYPIYLRKGGPVLGVAPDFEYRQGSLQLVPGDRLFLYTDGLTDEQNQDEEFFDLPRLLALLENHGEATPAHLLELIFSTINQFGGVERSDDKTAISLEIKRLKK